MKHFFKMRWKRYSKQGDTSRQREVGEKNTMFRNTEHVNLARTRDIRKDVSLIEHQRSGMWALPPSDYEHVNKQYDISGPLSFSSIK